MQPLIQSGILIEREYHQLFKNEVHLHKIPVAIHPKKSDEYGRLETSLAISMISVSTTRFTNYNHIICLNNSHTIFET